MQIQSSRQFDEERARDRSEARQIQVISLRNLMIGEWAAGIMQLSPEETIRYRNAMVALGREHRGEAWVIDRLITDLAARRVDVPPDRILEKASALLLVAEADLQAANAGKPDDHPISPLRKAA